MKRGFTLLEIIFVIVIIGILSSVLLPRFTRPTLQEAANQIVSHLQYTQHLAMIDNKFDPEDEFWYRSRWQIDFSNSGGMTHYTVYQDINKNGNINENEIARNPQNPSQLLSMKFASKKNTKELNLKDKYNIDLVAFSSSCSFSGSKRVSFDYLGRPLYGNPSALDAMYNDNFGATGARLIRSRCAIKFCIDNPCADPSVAIRDEDFMEIAIEPETGYIHII